MEEPMPAQGGGHDADLDRIDNDLLALATKRLRLGVEAAAGAAHGFAAAQAREVRLLRRLIAQAAAPADGELIQDLWRALAAAAGGTGQPQELQIAGGADPSRLADLARRHYGGRVRIVRSTDARAALSRARDMAGVAAVLPWPAASGPGVWWPALSESAFHPLRLVAGLPLRGARGTEPEAAVFARDSGGEAAGEDVTLALAFDPHHKAQRILTEAGVAGRELARSEPRVLFRLEGYFTGDSPEFLALARGGLDGFRILGAYARV